jgi:hypothetical protein
MVTILMLITRNFLGRLFYAGERYEVGRATAAHLIEKGQAREVEA